MMRNNGKESIYGCIRLARMKTSSVDPIFLKKEAEGGNF